MRISASSTLSRIGGGVPFFTPALVDRLQAALHVGRLLLPSALGERSASAMDRIGANSPATNPTPLSAPGNLPSAAWPAAASRPGLFLATSKKSNKFASVSGRVTARFASGHPWKLPWP